jgi:tryptophan-rich sensory protein
MPSVKSEDFASVALATLVPGTAALIGMSVLLKDNSYLNWWEKAAKPSWAPTDIRLYSAIDLLTMSPLGCASFLVYKHGGGRYLL